MIDNLSSHFVDPPVLAGDKDGASAGGELGGLVDHVHPGLPRLAGQGGRCFVLKGVTL